MGFVVGIDIGNENCVVAVYNNKGGFVDVLLNEASKRETPLLIHFDKKQRMFGSAGTSYSSRDPKASISQLKRLIGRRFDEKSFEEERKLLPYRTSGGHDGKILVTVDYQKQEWSFTAVELLGMFLSHLKKTAEKVAGDEITDCVIGVPSYLTNEQRKDYLLAAEMAGLKPRRLFHDGAAAALDYALSRDLSYGEPFHVVFVDIGHCDTQVTVVKFLFGTLTVLAHSFDRDLGGRDFDDLIFKYVVDKIRQNHKIDFHGNDKPSFHLRTACVKAKMVLSVNTEATIAKECLVNDIDVEETITRETFERMSDHLLKRIVSTCGKALTNAGLSKKEVNSIELVGSGSRVPKISQVLEDFFGLKTSRTLNASECIANGCALQCAMLCPTVRARTFGVQDMYPFSIGIKADKDGSLEPSNILAKGWPLLDPKTLFLHSLGSVIIVYASHNELPNGTSENVTSYKITSIDDSQKYYLEVRFQFDLNGILDALSAFVIDEEPFRHESSVNTDIMDLDDIITTDNNSSLSTSPNNKEDVESGNSFTKHHIELSEISLVAASSVLCDSLAKEDKMVEHDRLNERAKKQRNELEALLLFFRNQISAKRVELAREDHKMELVRDLEKIEEWLYGPGSDASEESYIEIGKRINLAYNDLMAEHLDAYEHAIDRRNELTSFADEFSLKLHSLDARASKKPEFAKIFGTLERIFKMKDECVPRPEREYIKELDELRLTYNAYVSSRRRVNAEKKTAFAVGLLNSARSALGWGNEGAPVSDGLGNDKGSQPNAASDSTRAAISIDEVDDKRTVESGTQLASMPIEKYSQPDDGNTYTVAQPPRGPHVEDLRTIPEPRSSPINRDGNTILDPLMVPSENQQTPTTNVDPNLSTGPLVGGQQNHLAMHGGHTNSFSYQNNSRDQPTEESRAHLSDSSRMIPYPDIHFGSYSQPGPLAVTDNVPVGGRECKPGCPQHQHADKIVPQDEKKHPSTDQEECLRKFSHGNPGSSKGKASTDAVASKTDMNESNVQGQFADRSPGNKNDKTTLPGSRGKVANSDFVILLDGPWGGVSVICRSNRDKLKIKDLKHAVKNVRQGMPSRIYDEKVSCYDDNLTLEYYGIKEGSRLSYC